MVYWVEGRLGMQNRLSRLAQQGGMVMHGRLGGLGGLYWLRRLGCKVGKGRVCRLG